MSVFKDVENGWYTMTHEIYIFSSPRCLREWLVIQMEKNNVCNWLALTMFNPNVCHPEQKHYLTCLNSTKPIKMSISQHIFLETFLRDKVYIVKCVFLKLLSRKIKVKSPLTFIIGLASFYPYVDVASISQHVSKHSAPTRPILDV